MATTYKNLQVMRTKCGRGRIVYDPVWSPSRPWLAFANGAQEVNFTTPAEAALWFFSKHKMHLVIE